MKDLENNLKRKNKMGRINLVTNTLLDKMLMDLLERDLTKSEDLYQKLDKRLKHFTNKSSDIDYLIIDDNTISSDIEYNYIFIKFYISKKRFEKVKEKLKEKLKEYEIKNNKEYKIIFVVKKIKDKIYWERKDNQKKFMNDIYGKRIKCDFFTVFMESTSSRTYDIPINDRCDSIINGISKNYDGFIVTVDLFDLVKLYNNFGDNLFKKNVRYYIESDKYVDDSIVQTLSNEPENFWAFNNGITIVTDDTDFSFEKSIHKLSFSAKHTLSIINGAQTISTAARFFYSEGNNDIINNAKKNAKVLLRVIYLKDKDKDSRDESMDKISIALNKQKSIKQKDIVYTYDFVKKLNEIAESIDDNKLSFKIVKRGEWNCSNHNYEIDEFAQLFFSYYEENPGDARSNKTSLIDYEPNDETGKNEFKKPELRKIVTDIDGFKKRYSPLNFAYELSYYFSNSKYAPELSDKDSEIVYKYGKMYFIAATINLLNPSEKSKDFTNFPYTKIYDIKNNISKIIKAFIDSFVKAINTYNTADKNHHVTIEDNAFKKDDMYKIYMDSLEKKDYQNTLLELFNKEN